MRHAGDDVHIALPESDVGRALLIVPAEYRGKTLSVALDLDIAAGRAIVGLYHNGEYIDGSSVTGEGTSGGGRYMARATIPAQGETTVVLRLVLRGSQATIHSVEYNISPTTGGTVPR